MNPSCTTVSRSSEFPRRVALLLLVSAGLSCSSQSQDPAEPIDHGGLVLGANQGQFIDSPVEGVQFISGRTAGTTTASGVYSFESGQQIAFSVGSIVLGSATPTRLLSPLHMAGTTDITDPLATNIARFLQTIDNDGNPANGIKITAAVREAAVGKSVNFVQPIVDFESDPNVLSVINTLTTATQAGPRELVDAVSAQSHLEAGIRSAFVGQYSGKYCIDTEDVPQGGGVWVMTVAQDGKAKFEFVGAAVFNATCAMALNGSVYLNDPEGGNKVCGAFAPRFLGRWSHGTMKGTFSEGTKCIAGSSVAETEQLGCGE